MAPEPVTSKQEIDWTPFGYGSSGRSHTIMRGAEWIQIRSTLGARLGTAVLLSVGPLCTPLLLLGPLMFFVVAFGWFVTAVIAYAIPVLHARVEIDSNARRVSRSSARRRWFRKDPRWVAVASFEEATGLQILRTAAGSETGPFYELNLLLRDGRRLHLVARDDLRSLDAMAEQINAILTLPIVRETGLG